jgi:hypothetical protein
MLFKILFALSGREEALGVRRLTAQKVKQMRIRNKGLLFILSKNGEPAVCYYPLRL